MAQLSRIRSPLSDRELLDATAVAAADERRSTVELVRLLAELDARRLYLSEGYSSLFVYCTRALHLAEHAAYHRIEAARAARQFPVLLDWLTEGALTLTTVALLRPHLTTENCHDVLTAARHRTKREVEEQIAALAPRPDVKPLVRRLPAPARIDSSAQRPAAPIVGAMADPGGPVPPPLDVGPATPLRATLVPLAPERYLLKVTVSAGTHAKLRRAQDLLRHVIPDGDPAKILDRGLTMVVNELERTKLARVVRPRPRQKPLTTSASANGSRRIPAAMKRAVWARDGGRCTFHGAQGPCGERGHLEFHHIVPFAAGGRTDISNLAWRCRAHNRFESEVVGYFERGLRP